MYANNLSSSIRSNLQAHLQREQSSHSAYTQEFYNHPPAIRLSRHSFRVQRSSNNLINSYASTSWLSNRFLSLLKCKVVQLACSLQIVLFHIISSYLTCVFHCSKKSSELPVVLRQMSMAELGLHIL